MNEQSLDLISQRLGVVTLEPADPVVPGSLGQWRLHYTVGSYGLDEGGTIKVAQRMVCDWEIPQFDRPTASGYTTVTTTGAAKVRAYYHRKAHERPWCPCLVIDIYDGTLAPGDTVTITLGDRSQGSPGMRAQTYQEREHEFRFMVDPTNAAAVRPLPTSPKFAVIAGAMVELVCILPTQAVVDQPVAIFVKGQDCWVNPTPAPTDLSFTWEGSGEPTIDDGRLIFSQPGSGHLLVSTADGAYTCRSNPITAYTEEPHYKRYWGDLHGQTAATVGAGTEAEADTIFVATTINLYETVA